MEIWGKKHEVFSDIKKKRITDWLNLCIFPAQDSELYLWEWEPRTYNPY